MVRRIVMLLRLMLRQQGFAARMPLARKVQQASWSSTALKPTPNNGGGSLE
jgi:hypothetical protein